MTKGLTLQAALMFALLGSVLLAAPASAQDAADPPKAKKDDKRSADKKKDKKKARDDNAAKDKKEAKAAKDADEPTTESTEDEEDLGGTPKAVIAEATHDFGTVWASADNFIKHTFTIKNEGDGLLKILSVKPACGCTLAGDHPDRLKPGESGEFPFKLKTETLAHAKDGKFSKAVTITTNDPEKPTLRLLLEGTARFHVAAPALISFGTLKADVDTERTETITNNTDKPLKLTLPETKVTPESPFKYELVEKEEGKVYELKVRTVPPLQEGRINGELKIQTNIEEQKELNVRVALNVPPRLLVRPSLVVYDPKRLTRPVTFTNNGSTDVKVTGATTDDPALDVEIEEMDAGKNYTIKVTFPENYDSSKTDRKLVIKTDDPEKPEIEVPIRTQAVAQRKRPAEELEGKPAPEFKLTSTAGKSLDNASLSTHDAVVLSFWAADCPYCKKALPRVDSVREEFKDKNVRFINVAETMRKKFSDEELKKVTEELKLGGELVTDQENTLGPKFKATSYPTMFILGKSGKVEMVSIGNVPTLEIDFKKKLALLTGGQAEAPATAAETGTADAAGAVTTVDDATGMTKTSASGQGK
ncbi:MAG: DUF1573 domain-containing protein [Phycisphaerales bacterium]|nr:MAG: DUF1573 domain-containing protein [Phycisphaerales bacterium]